MIEIQQIAQEISDHFTSRKKTQSILIFHESVIKALEGIDAVAKTFEDFQIGEAMTYGVRKTILGYTLRGGHPSAFDRILATRFGAAAALGIADLLQNSQTNPYPKGFAVALENNHVIRLGFDDIMVNKAARLATRQEKMKEMARIYCALANDKWMKDRLDNITLFSDDWANYDSYKLNIDLWKEFWKNRNNITPAPEL